MKTKLINSIKKIFEYFWLPLLFISLIVCLLWKITPINSAERFNTVFGIALGVLLGFVADISKKTLDKFQADKKIKAIAFKLLREDAKSIFKTMEVYSLAINSTGAPQGIRSMLPPELELTYWNFLSKKEDFLVLATEDNFTEIFDSFWSIEKLNSLILQVKKEQDQQQKKSGAMISVAVYQQSVKDKFHEKIIKYFMSDSEFKDFKAELKIRK